MRDWPRLSFIVLLPALIGFAGCATPPDADGDATGGPDSVTSQSESASAGLCECSENPQVDEFNAALQALAQGDFESAVAALSRHADLGGDRNRDEARVGRELADLLARYSVDGGTIAGRNMDGEIDFRKVTVTHLLVFAVDPGAAAGRRYVSIMGPGFIGTYSGFNEDGLYMMANAGCGGRADTLPPKE